MKRATGDLTRLLIVGLLAYLAPAVARPAEPLRPIDPARLLALFGKDNLVAWCIVPFDAKKRGPKERVEMMARLGIKKYAYDWRAEHLPTFDQELDELATHKIELTAVWFPGSLNADASFLLDRLKAHGVKTQLWVTGSGEPTKSPAEQQQRVAAEAARIKTIADAAAAAGCTVALYNHGGWFGEPENQLAIIKRLGRKDVGIVYNLHHGHEHVARFGELLKKMGSHLWVVNLNGMVAKGDQRGAKILPLAAGDQELGLMRTLAESDWHGPVGILNHTGEDAEARLADNLDGLQWLVKQLAGSPAGAKPKYRSYTAQPLTPNPSPTKGEGNKGAFPGLIVESRNFYRELPLVVDCRATLADASSFNILAACEQKRSATHWELFTLAGSGKLAAYLPGMKPDHVRSDVRVTDGQPHHLAFAYEAKRGRLFVDGKLVADQPLESLGGQSVPGNLAIGRLVEGGLGCNGRIEFVRIRKATADKIEVPAGLPAATDDTLGLWNLAQVGEQGPNAPKTIDDLSKRANPAKRVAAPGGASPVADVPPGNNLLPTNPKYKAVLIDRVEEDTLLGVKVDCQGRLFVGAREKLFVYEPKQGGLYEPRRELFRFPADSIIIGLELRGNDVYVATDCALYLLEGARVRRTEIRPKLLVWGIPLDFHVSIHSLAFGPQGRLMMNHGDPFLGHNDWSRPDHWDFWTWHVQPEGTLWPYTGTGAVLSFAPDGSQPRVEARGFRGPVGLAYDPAWNLYTNDNDHESQADKFAPARLIHVAPHLDYNWPRGWDAKMSPDRYDLVETMTMDLGRGVPCDVQVYDEPRLKELRGRLLMCRWDRGTVTNYELKPRGASFSAGPEQIVAQGGPNVRPSGLAVGRDGRIFVTQLYLAGNTPSPYCPSDLVMITTADDPADAPFEPLDVTTVDEDRLWAELSGDSWERRRQAHQELLRRGQRENGSWTKRLEAMKLDDRAFTSAIWLAASTGEEDATKKLVELAKHNLPAVRLQAVRALVVLKPTAAVSQAFEEALSDTDRAVKLAALDFFHEARLPFDGISWPRIGELACDRDTYLRKSATTVFAQRAPATGTVILDLLTRGGMARRGAQELPAEYKRLVDVLIVGEQLTVPLSNEMPPKELKLWFPGEGSFFHSKLAFAGPPGEAELRGTRTGAYTTAERWKFELEDGALRRLADEAKMAPPSARTALSSAATRLSNSHNAVGMLVRATDYPSEPVRLQAAYYLSLLNDPQYEPLVLKIRGQAMFDALAKAEGPAQRVERLWQLGPLDAGGVKALVAKGPIDLTAKHAARGANIEWSEDKAADGRLSFAMVDGSASYEQGLYFQIVSSARQNILLSLEAPATCEVWANTIAIPRFALKTPGTQSWAIEVQPGSNDIVLALNVASHRLSIGLTLKAVQPVSAALPERLDSGMLAARLKEAAGSSGVSLAAFADRDWTKAASTGNPTNGRRLFASLGCSKCHPIVAGQAGGGGPSLTDAKKRFTPAHVVESVLMPSKQIIGPFRATTLALKDGRVLTGLIVAESPAQVEILAADATRQKIETAQIEQRELTSLSPMPQGLVKTPEELTDLLSYVLSERPQPP